MSSIIFDFDGTIADSFAIFVEILHDLIRGSGPIVPAEVTRLQGMSPMRIAAELKIRPWSIPFLVIRGRRRIRTQMHKVKAFEGMAEVIKSLHADGHELYIMSSNSVQNILPFLVNHNLDTEFIKIYGNVGVFAKARVLRRVLRQNNLKAAETFYIGDEVRDVEAAKHAGIKIVSVTWGYNNAEILKNRHPDFLANKPQDILRVFK